MRDALAIDGGRPVRDTLLPYGRQSIDESDVNAVVAALRSEWLTTGPRVTEFEARFAEAVGARHAISVANGTAALHGAMHAIRIGPGDEVVVPAMTFVATANAVLYQGGRPVFADVDPESLLIDPTSARNRLSEATKALIAVDYAGQPADSVALRAIANEHGLRLVADACHALGATQGEQQVGSLADLSAFSMHPVKPLTTGEGGMVTTNDDEIAGRLRIFRNHGITSDHRQRERTGSFAYEMVELGYNFRLTDLQCALGLSQLLRLSEFTQRRQRLAAHYDELLRGLDLARPFARRLGTTHAFHLYVVQLDLERLRADRGQVFRALRAEGIGVNVHYVPVHLHPYYRQVLGTQPGDCPVAERAYRRILTLPLFSGMSLNDVEDTVTALMKVLEAYRA